MANETNDNKLPMEIAMPKLLEGVSTLPTACGGALCAVNVEN